jgi:uncharacterized protein (TIRG00374 family)
VSTRRPLPRALRRLAVFLLLGLVVEYLVLPQIAGARRALSLVSHVNLALVGVAVLLEAASLAAYAQLTRAVLPAATAPGLATTARIDLATLAVSHIVPGGAAAGTGVGFRLLTEAGVEPGDAGFGLAVQGLGSAVVLNVLLWTALVVSIPLHGFHALYGTAAIVGAVIIGGFSTLVVLIVRGEARAARILRTVARRLPFVQEETVHRLVHRVAARLRVMAADRPLLIRAVSWATANWLLDAACLWVFLAAFGHLVSPDALIVSYGLANVLAAIPLTPGGLGVVEAVLASSLVGFGSPRGVAILAVVAYRLVNFWLPIPVGGLAYAWLKVGRRGSREAKRRQLRTLAQQAVREAERPADWAARHGIAVRESSEAPGRGS